MSKVFNCDSLVFSGSARTHDDDFHITADGANHITFQQPVKTQQINTTHIQNENDENVLTNLDTDKVELQKEFDFNDKEVYGLGGFNRKFSTSQILSSNLSGQSPPNDTLDKELDDLRVDTNNNTNRTSGLTSNKIMISNNSGTLQVGNFSQDKIIRNDLATQQEVAGDINLASGKRIKYNGVSVEISSTDKLDKDFGNIGANEIPDANIPNTISRVADVNSGLALKANLAGATFTGDVSLNSSGITADKVLVVDTNKKITTSNDLLMTQAEKNAIVANTAKTGITTQQANDITTNNSKVGITTSQANAIVANTAKVGITQSQADAIIANTAKTGITTQQANDITTNNSKVGITTSQANAIVANTSKVGITTQQANDITTNNSKVGITTSQANAISANTSSISTINSTYIKRDGSIDFTGNILVPTLEVGTTGYTITKDGNNDLIFNIPDTEIYKLKINNATIATIDSGGIDLANGKTFAIDGTDLAVSSTDNTKMPLAGGTFTGQVSFASSLGLNGFAKIINNNLTAGFINNIDVPSLSSKTFTTSTLSGTTTLASGHTFSGGLKCDGDITLGNGNNAINFGDDGKPIISAFDNNLFFQTKNSGNDIIIKTFQASTTSTTNSVMFRDDYMEIDDGYGLRLNNVAGGNFIKTNSSTKQLEAGTIADGDIPTTIARTSALDLKVNKSTPTFTGQVDGFCKFSSNVLSGGHTIVDADIPTSIARTSITTNLSETKVNKATPTFTGMANGICKMNSNVMTSGTLVLSELPSGIALLNSVNTFGSTQVFSNGLTCNGELNILSTEDIFKYTNNMGIVSQTEYVASKIGQVGIDSLNTLYTSAPANTQKTISYKEGDETYTGIKTFHGSKLKITGGATPTTSGFSTGVLGITSSGFVELKLLSDSDLPDNPTLGGTTSTTNLSVSGNLTLPTSLGGTDKFLKVNSSTGVVEGSEVFPLIGQSANDVLLSLGAGNASRDVSIYRINSTDGTDNNFGFELKYNGSALGNDNSLSLIADNQNGVEKEVYEVNQDGKMTIKEDLTIGGDLYLGEGGKLFLSDEGNEPNINEFADSLFFNIKSTAPNYSRISFVVHNSSNNLHEALQLLGGSSFHDAHFREGFGIKIRGGDFVKYNSDTVATANEVFKITDTEVLQKVKLKIHTSGNNLSEINCGAGSQSSLLLMENNVPKFTLSHRTLGSTTEQNITFNDELNFTNNSSANTPSFKIENSSPYRCMTNNAPIWESFTSNSSFITASSGFNYSTHGVHSSWESCSIGYQKFIDPSNGNDVYRVYIRGLVVYTGGNTYVPSGDSNPIATIADSTLRPNKNRTFSCVNHIASKGDLRVDVLSNGKIVLQTSNVSTYVALGGIEYWTN